MYEVEEREIDVIDLISCWLMRFRSLAMCVLLGMVIAVACTFVNSLSSVAGQQTLSVTDSEIEIAEEVLSLEEVYSKSYDELVYHQNDISASDKAAALYYLVAYKDIIDKKIKAFSTNQRAYYEERIKGNTPQSALLTSAKTETTSYYRNGIVGAMAAFVFHFVLFAVFYIFNGRIKHNEKIGKQVGWAEYTPMIDWDSLERRGKLDKAICGIRYHGERRTPLKDSVKINALAVADELNSDGLKSIAIVGDSRCRDMFIEQISAIDEALLVKSIASVAHSVNGADNIMGIDAAILIVDIDRTKFVSFAEEYNALVIRGLRILGVMTYESAV